GHRARAFLAPRGRTRDLSVGDRRGGARSLRPAVAARGDHPGARGGACFCAGRRARAQAAARGTDGRRPFGARRQGRARGPADAGGTKTLSGSASELGRPLDLRLYLLPEIALCDRKVVVALQIDPECSACAQITTKAHGGLGAYAALA